MTTAQTTFPRHARLLNKGDFQAVFQDNNCRSSDQPLTLLARHNGLAYPRLGLAIGKKADKRAVARNRIKRLVRESFRHHQAQLAGLDIVVVGREAAARMENPELTQSLQAHWRRVADRCAKS